MTHNKLVVTETIRCFVYKKYITPLLNTTFKKSSYFLFCAFFGFDFIFLNF